ncbi:unnamed protein product [Gongylonema pulchrum]|uniref:Uncharacterized protein n=1 Tax=Gongylonema pulchrum TaxID=637853 RepID=A0A183DPI5_9BILA|nr:unnamed protein product [Gongylonema pulchrum]
MRLNVASAAKQVPATLPHPSFEEGERQSWAALETEAKVSRSSKEERAALSIPDRERSFRTDNSEEDGWPQQALWHSNRITPRNGLSPNNMRNVEDCRLGSDAPNWQPEPSSNSASPSASGTRRRSLSAGFLQSFNSTHPAGLNDKRRNGQQTDRAARHTLRQ